MTDPHRAMCTLTVMAVVTLSSGSALVGQRSADGDKQPSLALKATPPVGFTPLRVRVAVDVRGGSDDYADFYCPTIEWDWGDGTVSEARSDCEPYQAGTSAIQRRWTAEHIYRQSGSFKVAFRLKQKNKAIATTTTNVQVRAGLREDFGG
jgi:hypothetical protein